MKIRLAALAAVPLVAAVAVGITSASSAASGSPKFTASVKLMALGPINAQGFSIPSIPVGAQVAVNEINAAGGVGGKKLVLLQCNDNNDPNTGAACAVTAVKDKVAALVGGLSTVAPQIIPVLERAKIPWVGATPVGNYSSPILYLSGDTAPAAYAAAGEILVKKGCQKIAIISDDTPPSTGSDAFLKAGIEFLKGDFVGQFTAPQNVADWAPTVAAAQAAGADCIGLGTGPPESGPVITAIRQTGKPTQISALSGGLPAPVVAQLGPIANHVLVTGMTLPPTSHSGVVQKVLKAAHALNPKAPYDAFMAEGYASVEVVAHALAGLKNVTGATLIPALNKVKDFNTGVGPVVTLTKPNSNPTYSRIFDTKVYVWVASGGQFYESQTLNVAPVVATLP